MRHVLILYRLREGREASKRLDVWDEDRLAEYAVAPYLARIVAEALDDHDESIELHIHIT